MNQNPIFNLTKDLAQAHSTRTPLAIDRAEHQGLDLENAYEVQKHFVGQAGCDFVGWKVGATNEQAQQTFGFREPFYGRLLANETYSSPTVLSAGRYFKPGLETEFAFRMGRDLPPREKPYQDSEIREAIGELMPAIEIVDSRIAGWPTIPAHLLVADNGAHGSIVLGRPLQNWRLISLPDHPVHMQLNGVVQERGHGANVLGDPIRSVTWLANHLSEHQRTLAQGDVITTGSAAGVVWPKTGDIATAKYAELGEVKIAFED